jgi:hypothetical protein
MLATVSGWVRPSGARVGRGIVVNAQGHGRMLARNRLLAVLSLLSLTVLLFGLVAMHTGMLTDTDAADHSPATIATGAREPTANLVLMAPTESANYDSSDPSQNCMGMCDSDCLMSGTPCLAGSVAHSAVPISCQPVSVLLESSSPRGSPAMARCVPPARPPSLIALSVSRI